MAALLINKIVPRQHKGNHSVSSICKHYKLLAYAVSQYSLATYRMLQVNEWHKYAGYASAVFQLIDAAGNEVHRAAREGDFFQIDVPGPGSQAGGGNDWVRVEKIGILEESGEQLMYMRVRPSSHPLALKSEPAHFLSPDATSTFLVHRQGVALTAAVYGRNELPNTHATKWMDRLRNLLMAIGAFAGVSNAQWKPLVKGWLSASATVG